MTKGNPAWERFEHDVQELLGLRSTPGSGNQWHDVSDGRSQPDDPYKIMVDCKFTEKKSYIISGELLQKWWSVATELGFNFALPVRIAGAPVGKKDWVVVSLDDYVELVEAIRVLDGPTRCGVGPPSPPGRLCCRKIGHFGHHDNGEKEWSA